MKHIKTFDKLFEGLSEMRKYIQELRDNNIDEYILKRLDPSPTYKYIGMICKYALEGVHFDDIKKYIKAFDLLASKNKIDNKDIFSYKTFNDLKTTIDNIPDTKTKKEIIDEIRKEREIIIDNDDYLVFIPLSYEASIKYGMGAKWCISMKNDPFYWYALTNSNIIFYFVIVKNKKISDKLFSLFKDKLEESSLGEQGNKNDPTNFEKIAIFSRGKDKQIWTKSNHLLYTKHNNKFFDILGLPEKTFKNDLPYKELKYDDL